MIIRCATCEKEGKPSLIGQKEPLADRRVTHGICPDHRRALEAELRERLKTLGKLVDQVDP